jgi:alkylation response protein AidB-like acyl-CoA dehydrogenase
MNLGADPSAVPTNLDSVLDVIAAHAPAAEDAGRLPEAVIEALSRSGIYRTALPKELGGYGEHPGALCTLVEQIAAVDGSTGWCTAIGAGTNVFAGYLDRQGAAEVFAEPDMGKASIFGAQGELGWQDGRWRLTGRWSYGTFCLHADWIAVNTRVRNRSGAVEPEPRLVFAPANEFTIHRSTWDTTGLRATGSHDVSAEQVVIDPRRICRFSDSAWTDEPLWRIPVFTVLHSWMSSSVLGIARGALYVVSEMIVAQEPRHRPLAASPITLGEWAAADSAVRAARAGLRAALDDAWRMACARQPVGRSTQARVLLACIHACDSSVEAVGVAHRLAGGASTRRSHFLARCLRDVLTARQHIGFSHDRRATYAMVAAGSDEQVPPFII